MISSFEVGSVFQIVDKVSPTLIKMSEKLGEFSKIVAKTKKQLKELDVSSFRTLEANLKTATEQVVKLQTAVDSGIASTEKATGSVAALATEWRKAATAAQQAATAARAAARASGVPLLRPGMPGASTNTGRHSSRNLLWNAPSISTPLGGAAGSHYSGHGPGYAALGMGAYSVYEGSEVGDIVSRGLRNVFPEGNIADRDAKAKELTEAIKKEALITRLPVKTVAKMALDEIKTNSNLSWADRMKILPMTVENAAREAYTKNSDPEGAMNAFVGMLHQNQAFTLKDIEKDAPIISYFASRDPNSVANIARSGAYHTPIARSSMFAVPIEQDLAAQVILDQTGVGGKSGTWLREIVTRAAKPVHDKHYKDKVKLLQDWGLMDSSENSTSWMTDGHFDEQKELHILNKKMKGLSREERFARLKQVFGERASMGIAILSCPPSALMRQNWQIEEGRVSGSS